VKQAKGATALFGLTAIVAAPLVTPLATPLSAQAPAQAAAKRAFTSADVARIRNVSDPVVSPDGAWVAYVVSSADTAADRRQSDVWMTSWDGKRTIRLTHTERASERSPRWSPDGRWLAFLSGREGGDGSQLWLLERSGGEAERVTSVKGGVDDFVWSPDSKRLALVVSAPDPQDTVSTAGGDKKRPKPYVINRYKFKRDYTGYLTYQSSHLWLFDLATRKAEQLTFGNYEDEQPSWSPDGKSLAFSSIRSSDPDRTETSHIYRIEATPGAEPKQLTTAEVPHSRPVWSPDGRMIAFIRSGPAKLISYGSHNLGVVPADGGPERVLTPDKWTRNPQWSADGSSLYLLVQEDRSYHLARVPVAGGPMEKIVSGKRVVSDLSMGLDGKIAVAVSTPDSPAEIFAVDGANLRQLSHQNADLLNEVALGTTEEISFKSKDGTLIGGFVVKPPNYQPGRRYPTILRIHGGPVLQFQNQFDDQWQAFAARGYVVVAANPRGSSGRGEKFSSAIYADWGNKDVQDVLAAVDYVVAQGIADPARLGVGGWSYGGMLTNYVIASDTRFKAATSGASISNILAGYGTDQYIHDYDNELGQPSKNLKTWLRLSYPYLHADRIVTPTLFLCGDKDFNVPLLNTEQMYQSLKSLGRETELVIYPGEYHGISRPSFVKDRLDRYVAWYDKYLGAAAGVAAAGR
jgi:dipeptidyl aminopeptidase/acylaminoacyl peptidase